MKQNGILLVWFALAVLALLPRSACAHTQVLFDKRYVALAEVGRRLGGMPVKWLQPGKSAELSSQWTSLRFTEHRRDVLVNGVRVHLGDPVVKHKGALYISELDYAKTLLPVLAPQRSGPVPGLRRIVLDPGHGGKDAGGSNVSLGLKEKALTLDLARRLKLLLEQRGYEVFLTRERDVFIELSDRAAFANRLGADLFVSIHFNAAADASASGAETFAMTPVGHPSSNSTTFHRTQNETYPGNRADNWSELAAFQVQQAIVGALGVQDRGVRRSRFAVLRDLNGPGIMIEGAFMTNPREGAQLGHAAYRQRLAEIYADGISDYHKMLEQARARQPR